MKTYRVYFELYGLTTETGYYIIQATDMYTAELAVMQAKNFELDFVQATLIKN